MKSVASSYLPSQYGDVLGLLARTLRSGDPAGRSAVVHTALGLIAQPADLLLRRFDRRLEARAPAPSASIVIVCGPPRSGTTLVEQTLLRHLPVTYFSNLTNIFPRSPISATRLFGRKSDRSRIATSSYYGRTRHLSGPNDALYLWDRWLGGDRQAIPEVLDAEKQAAMASFFGAWQSAFPGPVVTKNNRLILLANVVGEALPAARFLCLRREPVGLAISLLEARKAILNDPSKPYGAVGPEYFRDADGCPPELQVCLQVRYYEDAIRRQQQMLGPERFQIVEYGWFCGHPSTLVQEIGHQLRIDPLAATLSDLKPFRDAGARPGRTTLRPVIERYCRNLGLLRDEPSAPAR